MPAWFDQDDSAETRMLQALERGGYIERVSMSTQPCGCDPGCKPKPHVCQLHQVQEEALDILEAIIYASDGCQGHRNCNHSMEPWQRARAFLSEHRWREEDTVADRPEAPDWWKSQGPRRHDDPMTKQAMIDLYNKCTKGPTPAQELAPGERPHVCGLSGTGFSCPACEVLSDQEFPQDASAASSVLGDTCPRCGGQLEQHEGLERDYPSCPRCR